MKTNIPPITCKRCGHQWFPRCPIVRVCPKCKSPYWDTVKKLKSLVVVLCLLLAGCGGQGETVVNSPPPSATPAVESFRVPDREFQKLNQYDLGLPLGCGPVAATTWLWWLGQRHFLSQLPPTPEDAVYELNGYMSAGDGTTVAEFVGGIEFFLSSRGVEHSINLNHPATVEGLETAKAYVAAGHYVWLYFERQDGSLHIVPMIGFDSTFLHYLDTNGVSWVGVWGDDPLFLHGINVRILSIVYLSI